MTVLCKDCENKQKLAHICNLNRIVFWFIIYDSLTLIYKSYIDEKHPNSNKCIPNKFSLLILVFVQSWSNWKWLQTLELWILSLSGTCIVLFRYGMVCRETERLECRASLTLTLAWGTAAPEKLLDPWSIWCCQRGS